MSFIIGAIKIIFLLGFLITIHEGGHFFVAKLCKVRVREFSIGFGPKLFSKQGKETKYTLRVIPFGGYVDMIGENEREEIKGSFSEASVVKRLAIVVAGAVVNIVFGITIYFILLSFYGNNASTTILSIIPEYSENLEQLEIGDEILKINDKKIHLKTDIDEIVSESQGNSLILTVKRNDEIKEIEILPTKMNTKTLGTYFSSTSDLPKIKYVVEASSAERAGVMVNDLILKINDYEIQTYSDISEIIDKIEDTNITLEVERDGEKISFNIELGTYTSYILGVYVEPVENTFLNNIYYAYWRTIDYLEGIIESFMLLFTGNVNINQMTGPIGISEMVVETSGIYDFVSIMSLISLSLGITNLLPIPALDGGKIVILIIEGISRKPLKQEVEMQIQMIGFTLLILFSIYISYKDILRIF